MNPKRTVTVCFKQFDKRYIRLMIHMKDESFILTLDLKKRRVIWHIFRILEKSKQSLAKDSVPFQCVSMKDEYTTCNIQVKHEFS